MPEILRHKKTGGLYEVLFRGARVRAHRSLSDYDLVLIVRQGETGEIFACSSMFNVSDGASILFAAIVQSSAPLVHGAEVIIYRAIGGGPVWTRPTSEMDDGRFEPAGTPQATSADAIIREMFGRAIEEHGALADASDAVDALCDQVVDYVRTDLLSRARAAGIPVQGGEP